MKTRVLFIICLLLGISISFQSFKKGSVIMEELAIGSTLPKADVKLKDISSKDISLNDVKTNKGLLVMFSCNTCPYVILSEARTKEIQAICKADGIGMIIINSNEAQRDSDDSFEAMKKYAAKQAYQVPYVLDVNSELANAFGAGRTPQCFLFNNSKLIYKGAIDDNIKDVKLAKQFYLKDAIKALKNGTAVPVESTKSIGCTIKRVE
jgi:thioredoxin-related protein